jgi:hypothetical protein
MLKYSTLSFIMIIVLFTSIVAGVNPQISVSDVSQPVISLNGTWKISMTPPEKFWENDITTGIWSDIEVPGECAMQGFAIKHNLPFLYKTHFQIPADYEDKKIILRFDGVYSYAKVWVNGTYIRDHSGGFTRWECDITQAAKPGKTNILMVQVEDRADEISYGSGYAKHPIGGILRNVSLRTLPVNHLEELTIETDWDEQYQNAEMKIYLRASTTKDLTVKFELIDPEGEPVRLNVNSIHLDKDKSFGIANIPVKNPEKWDAEHPKLYTLVTKVLQNSQLICTQSHTVGFREMGIKKNKMLVNGKEVKLRGANRHDIHPLLGRMTTAREDEKDVLLAKECNINFIRTSHYPPSEDFLTFCDTYGIYTEVETAVCFVNSHRSKDYMPGNSQDDSAFTNRYLSQLEEMVSSFRNHPSVIMWSIGNENTYGSNFQKSYDWVKAHDPTRPVIYSYPGDVPGDIQCYDILSMHYPSYEGNLKQRGIEIKNFTSAEIPVIFDEWAHVPCYNKETVKDDPNVREFWGQSLDKIWTGVFETEGALGGAIWGMIDETFQIPEGLAGYNEWWGTYDPQNLPPPYEGYCVGYGEWGIIDVWRRKKPEFWNTKKAYSPVRVLVKKITAFKSGEELYVPVYNRFDHTNFDELRIEWKYGEKAGIIKNVSLAPHTKGALTLPPNQWEQGRTLDLIFYQNETEVVDAYQLSIGGLAERKPNLLKTDGPVTLSETDESYTVAGDSFRIKFDKETGLITSYNRNGRRVLSSGPYLNLRTAGSNRTHGVKPIIDHAPAWKLDRFSKTYTNDFVDILMMGHYDSLEVSFKILINGKGDLLITYTLQNQIREPIQELGLRFIIPDNYDTLAWKRNSYWTVYPLNHIGRAEGKVPFYHAEAHLQYRQEPQQPWSADTWSFYYDGMFPDKYAKRLTNVAKATKENILHYQLQSSKLKTAFSVESDGSAACRISKDPEGNLNLKINQLWDYVNISWGNYWKKLQTESAWSGSILIRFSDL